MSNPFTNWTPETVAAHNARVNKREKRDTRLRNELSAHMPHSVPLAIKQIAPTKKPLLNATELLFKAELERRGHKIILCQAITFRLGDRMTYRPDFVTVESLYNLRIDEGQIRLTCYETKSRHRFAEKGIVKLKAAAAMMPWIRFVLVMRDGKTWTERTITQ
jgi:hypothetical protein